MSSGYLSSAQFGGNGSPSGSSNPTSSTSSAAEAPLPLSAGTEGSAKGAAAWRKPNRVLPYSKATSGSVFKPFD